MLTPKFPKFHNRGLFLANRETIFAEQGTMSAVRNQAGIRQIVPMCFDSGLAQIDDNDFGPEQTI
jgi:hypothetical protein